MPPLTRITITIPENLVRAADKRARSDGRSRSWVIADALRRDLALPATGLPNLATAVHEPAAPPWGRPGSPTLNDADATGGPDDPELGTSPFDAARLLQLEADLALTPADRLAHAEALADLADRARPRPRRRQVVAFETLNDFATWKAARRIGA